MQFMDKMYKTVSTKLWVKQPPVQQVSYKVQFNYFRESI